jgi:arabinofuranosyltransferase
MSQQRSFSFSHLGAAALVLGATAWMLLRERYFSGWVDDDAFISFRYARNLAEGNGLVFNLGERVEGYTNFLWTVILASLYKLGAFLPDAARFLGGLCSVATVGVLLAFSRTRLMAVPEAVPTALRLLVALVAPLALCFSDAWAAWAAGGLENTFSALLVVAALLAHVIAVESEEKTKRRRAWTACAFVLSLAVLNHPTNALFVIPVAVHWILLRRSGARVAAVRPAVLVFLAIVGSWTAWRLAYYGDLLPNTFYAKVGFSRFVLQRGMSYSLEVLRALPLAYAALAGVGVMATRRPDVHRAFGLLGGGVLFYSAYIVAVGGEQFPALRATIVLFPLFALLLQQLAHLLCRIALRGAPGVRAASAALVVALVVAGHAVPLYWSPRIRILDEALRLGRTALSTTAAMRLKELLPPDTLFAHSGAGLIAFHTNFRWIDTLGLTDAHIARTKVENMGKGAAGHEKGDGAYVWLRQPDYIMFPGYPISNRMPGTKGGRELFAIPEFRTTYRSVRLPFQFQGPNDDVAQEYALFLWQRVDLRAPSGG